MSAPSSALAFALAVADIGGRRPVHVRPAPLDRALVTLAAQLHVSFGGDVHACGSEERGLSGRLTPAQAFAQITRGSPCRVAEVGAGSWVALPVRPVASRARAPQPSVPAVGLPQDQAEAPVSEVLVTAGRSATQAAQFPGSRVIVAGALLGGSAHRDDADLTRDLALVETTNLGPGRDKIFVRGLSDGVFSGLNASTVAIYLDDLPISYNAPDPDLRLADVERVEVLAGPQGALFGAGAIGGVVRLVPRAPDLLAAGGEVAASLSSVAHGGQGSNVETSLNLPLVRDRLAVRAVAYREAQPGYIDDLGLGARHTNGTVREGGRLSALLRISPGWSASASFVYQDIDSASAQYLAQGGPALTRSTREPTPQDNDFGVLSGALSGSLPFASLRLSAALIRHTAVTTYDASPATALFGAADSPAASYDETHRRLLAFGEALLTSPPARPFAWSAGVFLARTIDDSRERLGVRLTEPLLFREDRRDQLDEAAIFGEAAYRVLPRLTLRVGLRVSRSALAVGAQDQQPLFATSASFTGRIVTVDASPKVQLELPLTRDLFAYASFATGFRPAGLNTAAPPGEIFGANGEVRVIRSDTARTYEIGTRWTLKAGYLRGALFYTDWLGIQSDQFSAYGLPMALNIGDGVVFGGELEGAYDMPLGFGMKGSLLLADQSLTADRNPNFPTRADSGLPGVAPLSAALSLTWRRQLGTLTLSTLLRARYVGPSRLTFSAAPAGRMGDYLNDSAELSASQGAWRLTLALENLADSRANTFAFGDPFLPSSVRQTTPLRPRTLSLELRRTF